MGVLKMRRPRADNRQAAGVLLLVMVLLSACGPDYDQAYERLLSHIPNAIRARCDRVEYTFVGIQGHPPPGELGSAICGRAIFTLFETKQAMDGRYERLADPPPQEVIGEDCGQLSDAQTMRLGSLVAEHEYAVGEKVQGMVFCRLVLRSDSWVRITWTNERTLVLGSAQTCCLRGSDRATDLNRFHRLYDWWQHLLGADRSASD
jgi:hypothetical protein